MPNSRRLNRLTTDELLDLRLCDLPLRIRGSSVERRLRRLYHELEARDLRVKPHVWLSDEWFTPDKVTGFAIPFTWRTHDYTGSSGARCSK